MVILKSFFFIVIFKCLFIIGVGLVLFSFLGVVNGFSFIKNFCGLL